MRLPHIEVVIVERGDSSNFAIDADQVKPYLRCLMAAWIAGGIDWRLLGIENAPSQSLHLADQIIREVEASTP